MSALRLQGAIFSVVALLLAAAADRLALPDTQTALVALVVLIVFFWRSPWRA